MSEEGSDGGDEGGSLSDDELGDETESEQGPDEPDNDGAGESGAEHDVPPMPEDYGTTDPETGEPTNLTDQERQEAWERENGYDRHAEQDEKDKPKGGMWERNPERNGPGGGPAGKGQQKRKRGEGQGSGSGRSWLGSLLTLNLHFGGGSKTTNVTGVQFGGGSKPSGSGRSAGHRNTNRATRRRRR